MPDLSLYSCPLDSGETRVAVIRNGMWDDPICCHLEHVKIEAATKIPYVALSYVWGSSKAVETIRINGQNHDIGINLACAMRHLRDEELPVMIWIDAVCINQENLVERSEQVAMMRDIYSCAQRVVVFLGEGSYYRIPTGYAKVHPQAAVSFWNDSRDEALLDRFRQSWHVLCKRPPWFSFCTISLIRLLSDLDHRQDALQCIADGSDASRQRLFELLRALINSQWWHRIWVVQEITVSPEVSVQYGNVTAPWRMFEQAAASCDRLGWGPNQDGTESFLSIDREHAKVLPRFSRQVLEIKRLRLQWNENGGADLLSLLQEFSGRLASDERDKVFALLGLAPTNLLISPNYSLDTLEVYRRTVVGMIEDRGSLAALTGDLRRKNSRGFPSWVPDWAAIFEEPDYRRMVLQRLYSACSYRRMRFAHSEKEYWKHVLRRMQGLLETLESRRQKLPILIHKALRRYRESIQIMAITLDQSASRMLMMRIGQVCQRLEKLNKDNGDTLRIEPVKLFESSVVFMDQAAWMRCFRDPRVARSLTEQPYASFRKQQLETFKNNTEILPTDSRVVATVNWCGPRLVTWIDATSRLLSVSQWVVKAQELCLSSPEPDPFNFLRALVGDIHEASLTGFRRLSPQDYDRLRYWFVNSLLPTLSAANPAVDKEAWNMTLASYGTLGVRPGEQMRSFDKEMRLATEAARPLLFSGRVAS
ncbi:hypothetical protein ACJ41O_007223 [Fusarium nematophilum]